MTHYLADKGHRILRNHFNIIPIKPGDKAPSIKNWQQIETTEADLNRWVSNGRATHGIGITTALTPLVDIDIFDVEMNRKMVQFVELHVGFAPIRVGNPPKRGLLFQSPVPFRKITSRAFTDPAGKKAQIEILGEGEQFVAFHIHPDTHKPYRWLGSDTPETLEPRQLPILTQEKGRAIVAEFERLCDEAGWPPWRGNKVALPAMVDDDDDPFGPDTSPIGLSDDELRDYVMTIPNHDADYDFWFEVGMAIHHETGGSEYGHDLWYEWSDQALKHNDEKFEKSWNSFGKYDDQRRPVTARLLIKLAKEHKAIETAEAINELIRKMELTATVDELRLVAFECRKIDADIIDRSRLIHALQQAVRAKTNSPLGIKEAREMVRYRPEEGVAPDWLDGWCYLKHAGQFYHRQTGERISREAFDAAHGRFIGTDTTAARYALETIKIPVFHMTIYLPSMESVFTDASGLDWINTYSEKSLPAVPAILSRRDRRNIAIVEAHFYHMFDDKREIQLFISWLAYIVQSRMRPNWAIVMQGAETSGKTYFAELMAAVIGGSHVYILGTDTLQKSDFTSWAQGHQLVFIEELKLHGHNRYDILNKLKPYISNTQVEIHPKGIDPYNVPNTAAYLAATNYRDALPLHENDSRYFVLMSHWQSKQDVDNFKLENPAYYSDLFNAIQESPGALRKWLLEYPLHPQFNAVDRAPFSHGKKAMIEEAKSDEQITIEELIAEGKHPLISRDLIAIHVLKEIMADEMGVVSGIFSNPRGVRIVLQAMGYTPLVRVRIADTRFSCWTHNHGLVGANYDTVQKLIEDRLDPL